MKKYKQTFKKLFIFSFIDFSVDFGANRMYNTYERVLQKGVCFGMNEDFSPDLLTLVDEDGQEHEFEILDIIENDEGCFYALLPTFEDPQDQVEADGSYYIFQAFEEDGEQQLAEVEDDELADRLAAEFEKRFDEMFEAEESEEE
jgi:uncharacterized protein YrzB (UPF0473 family)